jgi:hypothetical protein
MVKKVHQWKNSHHYTVCFLVYNFDIKVPQPLKAKLNLKNDLLGSRLVLKFFLYWLAKFIVCKNPPKYHVIINSDYSFPPPK